MATLAFGVAGAAIGSGLAGSATTVVIAGMTASSLGFAVGAAVGGVVDSMYVMPALFGGAANQSGPRLTDLNVQMASEGSGINICYGPECRCVGSIIWAPPLTEDRTTESPGGKHGGSTTYYRYLSDFAVLICRGPITRVRKIWSDSKLIYDNGDAVGNSTIVTSNQISLTVQTIYEAGAPVRKNVRFESPSGGPNLASNFGVGRPLQTVGYANAANNRSDWHVLGSNERNDGTSWILCSVELTDTAVTEAAGSTVELRQEGEEADQVYAGLTIYTGTTSQTADPVMEAVEGAGNVPAFRGKAYAVFEQYNLRDTGNRLPQLSFLVEEATSRSIAEVIADILEGYGLTSSDYDVSAVTGNVTGYVVIGPTTAVKALEPLMLAYNLGVREAEGRLVFFMRASTDVVPVDADDLAAHESDSDYSRLVTFTSTDQRRLPAEVVVNYVETSLDWQRSSQSHRRQVYVVEATTQVDLPLAMTAGEAQAICQRLLYTSWAERLSMTGSLPPSYLHVQEGDHLSMTIGERSYLVRVDELTRGFNLRVEFKGTVVQSQVNTTFTQADLPAIERGTVYAPPECAPVLADLPPLTDAQAAQAGFSYATFAYDPSALFLSTDFQQSTDGTNYTSVGTLASEATGGYTATTLASGAVGVWDTANTVDVELMHGSLSSASELDVLAGTNWALIGNEIVGFRTATQLSDGTYRLSNLLRGLRNTEAERSTHHVSEQFVLLNGLNFHAESLATLGLRYARSVAGGGTAATADVVSTTLVGKTLRPFTPAHFKVLWNSLDDARFTWVRRGRGPTRTLSGASPVLYESDERYEIDIYTLGGVFKRTISAYLTTTATYTAAQQVADGLTAGASFIARVYQVDTAYGRSLPSEITT